MTSSWAGARCRCGLRARTTGHDLNSRYFSRPSFAPRPVPNLKHIRQNPGLYEQNCIDRKYAPFAQNGWRILDLHRRLVEQQYQAVEVRQRSIAIGKILARQGGGQGAVLKEAQELKNQLSTVEAQERDIHNEMERLALELPNLSSSRTPVGDQPVVLSTINPHLPTKPGPSHLEIGKTLDILDFEASAVTSGWGWYFLKNEGALLEQALVQYALSVAMQRGWKATTPPSLVYSHIASACGFAPRDQNGETQIYSLTKPAGGDDRPGLVLAGTAEIPFAGSRASQVLDAASLPLKIVGASRCYRAEAGARGVDTKGLYRVHEFTKVEMFAWTAPPGDSEAGSDGVEPPGQRFGHGGGATASPADAVFDEMLAIQTEILAGLQLPAKVLEMPSHDLGASAARKVDIEAFFPSRPAGGFGELTSASLCADYQSRRLDTRLRLPRTARLTWPHTVNGTALAVPRVLACILENHWDAASQTLRLPAVLTQYMPGEVGVLQAT